MQPPQRSPFKGGAGDGVVVSQIGWDGNSASNLLTLMPAGHAAGMYQVSLSVIIRTIAGATSTVTVAWTSPTFGAESQTFGQLFHTAAGTGTVFRNTNTTTAPHRCAPIMSTGAAAITLQMATSGSAGVLDIYASARLIAA